MQNINKAPLQVALFHAMPPFLVVVTSSRSTCELCTQSLNKVPISIPIVARTDCDGSLTVATGAMYSSSKGFNGCTKAPFVDD